MDVPGLELLWRNIERLICERRLGLDNKLLDHYQLALRSGSFESEPVLGLQAGDPNSGSVPFFSDRGRRSVQ